jgi:hypothetical protein
LSQWSYDGCSWAAGRGACTHPNLTLPFAGHMKVSILYHQESGLGKIHFYIRALTSAKQCSNGMTRHENLQTCHGHTSSLIGGSRRRHIITIKSLACLLYSLTTTHNW